MEAEKKLKKSVKIRLQKEAEKKKLRKELERLRKAHQRAVKALDDFVNDQKESRYPMEDLLLMEEEKNSGKQAITPSTGAAARIPDILGFPNGKFCKSQLASLITSVERVSNSVENI